MKAHNTLTPSAVRTWAVAALLGLVALAPALAAGSNCDKPRNDFDDLYCLNKVYGQADKDLNDAYKELVGKLDANGRSALKTGQLAWINERNSRCSRRDGSDFFVNLSCATDTTVSRLQFLQDRLRECKSTGCQPSKL